MDRRRFLGKLVVAAAENAQVESAVENKSVLVSLQEREILEKRVKPYGITGGKLPMLLKSAIAGMPKGHELNNWQVVLVTDLNKWLDTLSKELKDPELAQPAARKSARLHVAEVINGKFPIYLNNSHETVQRLIADPHGIEVLKSYLLHERVHAIDMTAPHSHALQVQYEYLERKKSEGKILPRYHGFIDAVRTEAEKQREVENRVK